MCGSLFTAYKYSIYNFLKMSRIKIELSKTFTQFSPVYHKTITKGYYNIDKIKEGARPQGRPAKGRKVNTMKYYAFIDTLLREVTLFTTKAEVKAEYTLRKAIDSTLPFIGCDHYKIAVVEAPYKYTGKEV